MWNKILGIVLMLPLIIVGIFVCGSVKAFIINIAFMASVVLIVVAFATGVFLIIES